jgi:hypothetical protein
MSVVTEVKNIKTSIHAFYLEYDRMPGVDMSSYKEEEHHFIFYNNRSATDELIASGIY